ncbi:MAG: 2-amino-4-oxopentanoate thiolase subunit OrtA [Halanaerobium sp.]|nr:2-amino-4-oxopentanoate thiolase subunit OrtA [Halanaerobium sp.]
MEEKARRGDWVQIHQNLLSPAERAPQLPAETRDVPLEFRVKGYLQDEEAIIGDEVEIKTVIGRTYRGELEGINPRFAHTFGRPVPELLPVGRELKELLKEGGR